MDEQPSLFDAEPEYCIDTNVIVSFLSDSDDEFYGSDVFAPQWAYIEKQVDAGRIIAPRQVEVELEKWQKNRQPINDWRLAHRQMFKDLHTNSQLSMAKKIVNAYPAYGSNRNYLGDLEVMTFAHALGLCVVSIETSNSTPSKRRPKIPDVCAEFGIECVSVPGFFRRDGYP